MFSVVLSLGLLAVASSRQQLTQAENSPQRIDRFSEATKLTIDIPPVDQRNPAKCELYESSHMEEGCHQTCSVSGYFANHRIREAQQRKISKCRATGSFCRVRLAQNAEMNVTLSNGLCTRDCRCVPVDRSGKSELLFGLEQLAGALVAKVDRQRNHRRINHGLNHYGKLRIHVPSSESRNQSRCEEYEQKFYPGTRRREEFQCKDVCSIRGHLGQLWLQGKARVLSSYQQEGAHCELKTQGEGKFEVRGAEQIISGRCRKGVCRPPTWKEDTAASGDIHVSGEAMKDIKDLRNKDVVLQTL